MNDKKKQGNSHFEINDLIDDAVNNALARRSEAILPLSDEEATSISGGTALPTTIIHGVVINPCPQPTPFPPTIHGVVIKPPTIHGVVINPCPGSTPFPPIIHGVVLNPNPPETGINNS
ncbi:hypothetical protein NIES2100_28800 [Calothrix sp. NIES-2100]|uniref:hypothetical protein n=1 Tax=Calothrix sp. NIES-2100 TaxID=1954172 RepID=UPI000B5EE615|nr:hypothetical protein NIES2100_28800 [Calothrix sp. NIES-2100]